MLLPAIRLLVALLLAFTVPVQGFAAAAAGLCMQTGHHDSASAHAHDEDAGGGHHSHGDDGKKTAAHCAPCVACCAAAAISASATALMLDERADQVNALGPPSFAGIAPATLDRPPLAL